jgi:hypothetical protein
LRDDLLQFTFLWDDRHTDSDIRAVTAAVQVIERRGQRQSDGWWLGRSAQIQALDFSTSGVLNTATHNPPSYALLDHYEDSAALSNELVTPVTDSTESALIACLSGEAASLLRLAEICEVHGERLDAFRRTIHPFIEQIAHTAVYESIETFDSIFGDGLRRGGRSRVVDRWEDFEL